MSHAYLSASGSERWLNCTPSPFLESGLPDKGSIYASEGTLAHTIGEMILSGKWKNNKTIVNNNLFYEGMVDEVEIYTDYCIERLNELRAEDPLASMHIEERLDFSNYVPKGFGTGDCILIGNGMLEIVDLKFGKGVPVSPEENSQLMLYALGAINELGFLYDFDSIQMTVAQVRTTGITSHRMHKDDLIKWGEEYVKPRAELASAGVGTPNPGEWCRFCKFKAMCKERAEVMQRIIEDNGRREAAMLKPVEISEILKTSKLVTDWLKDIEEFALDTALEGTEYPGWKVVEGRSNRRITDEDMVAAILIAEKFEEEKIYKPKALETLTNLEKLVGKKKFPELVGEYLEKPKGRPVLVVETDKRPPYVEGVEDEFDFD